MVASGMARPRDRSSPQTGTPALCGGSVTECVTEPPHFGAPGRGGLRGPDRAPSSSSVGTVIHRMGTPIHKFPAATVRAAASSPTMAAMPPNRRDIEALARARYDVITRAQLLGLGATPTWISYQVASGRWQRVLPGAYAIYTGTPTWRTRASAALAYAGVGAALSHRSAGFVHEFFPTAPRVIDVTVPVQRRVADQPGLVVHRRRRLAPAWGGLRATDRPHTVLDLVAQAEHDDDVVGIVCAAVRARTWPREICDVLGTLPRVRHRALLLELLAEVADGIESPLERRYHRDVERRHGLPRARLQARERLADGWIRADARYTGLGVRVELDGALAHPFGRTDADTWRDNAVLITDAEITLRYRWGHVVTRPCEVAAQVGAALATRGWAGRGRPCGPGCAVGRAQQ